MWISGDGIIFDQSATAMQWLQLRLVLEPHESNEIRMSIGKCIHEQGSLIQPVQTKCWFALTPLF